MKNKLIMAGIAMLALAISSCDEDTDTMGYTLTSESDRYAMATDTFLVNTRSIIADSVLSRSAYSFLGRIKDPETGTDINCDYMTQFVVLENEADRIFPVKDSLLSIDAAGLPIADSVTVSLVVESYQGDSLAAMKLNLTELDHPVEENRTYYTNFDPEAEGYLREADSRRTSSIVWPTSLRPTVPAMLSAPAITMPSGLPSTSRIPTRRATPTITTAPI